MSKGKKIEANNGDRTQSGKPIMEIVEDRDDGIVNSGTDTFTLTEAQANGAQPANPLPHSPVKVESKGEKFRRLASKRRAKAIKALSYVANLSNRATYEYTPEQAAWLCKGIREMCDVIEDSFTATKATAKKEEECPL